MNYEIVLYAIKLCLGGFAAFFAILLTTRTREEVWVFFSSAIAIKYVETVIDMLVALSVILPLESYGIFGKVLYVLLSSLPDILFILGLVVQLLKNL